MRFAFVFALFALCSFALSLACFHHANHLLAYGYEQESQTIAALALFALLNSLFSGVQSVQWFKRSI